MSLSKAGISISKPSLMAVAAFYSESPRNPRRIFVTANHNVETSL
jgi:hypothetical protein